MKNFMKSNWMIIVSLSILVIWFTYSIGIFLNQFYTNKELVVAKYETECYKKDVNNERCMELERQLDGFHIPPAPLLYTYIIASGASNIEYLYLVAVLFVSIPAIYLFSKDITSGMYKNKLTREKYTYFLKKHYRKSLKCLLILPLFLIITFLMTCIVSKFKFQYSIGELEYNGDFFWSRRDYARSLWIPYFLTMLYALITHSIYYINTAYIMFYKAKNFVVNIVATYLCYLITQTTIISLISMFFGRVLKMGEFAITLSDPEMWLFGTDVSRFEYMIISSLFYALLSTVIVFLLYHKKERFVMYNE